MEEKKKKSIAILLLFVFLGTTLFHQNVSAGWLEALTDPIGNVTRGLAWAITGTLGLFASFLLEQSQSLLGWVISSDFIGVTMTGMDNPIIGFAWPIVRDLANIFLLLGLIVIGLGIILGVEEYQAKKSLPRLIAIAILINFTLVICGFVIDFTNLLMNYLLGGGSLPPSLHEIISTGIAKIGSEDPFAGLAVSVTYFLFGVSAAIVYGLYAILFIVRYVMLWILVIFAPIAFVSKVFSGLKNVEKFFPSFFNWDEWWAQFIQWSAIGIYAAFFVSLASKLMVGMASNEMKISSPSGSLSFFGEMFRYVFPFALLLIGFFSILETNVGGIPGLGKTLGLIAKTDKEGKIRLGAAGRIPLGAGGAAVDTVAGAWVGEKKGIEKAIKAGRGPLGAAGEALWEGAKGALTPEGRARGREWATKKAERIPLVGPRPGTYETEVQKKTSEAEKRLEKVSEEGLNFAAYGKTALTDADRVERAAALNIFSKRGKLSEKNMQYAEKSQAFGFDSGEALKRMPQMARRFDKNIEEVVQKEAPVEFAKNVQKEALRDSRVFYAASAKQIEVLMEKGSEDKKQAIREMVEANKKRIHDDIVQMENQMLLPMPVQDLERLKRRKDDLEKKLGLAA